MSSNDKISDADKVAFLKQLSLEDEQVIKGQRDEIESAHTALKQRAERILSLEDELNSALSRADDAERAAETLHDKLEVSLLAYSDQVSRADKAEREVSIMDKSLVNPLLPDLVASWADLIRQGKEGDALSLMDKFVDRHAQSCEPSRKWNRLNPLDVLRDA